MTEVRGVVFPEGTRSVLFFGRHGGFGASPGLPGGGGFCYGFGTADPALVGTFPPGEADHYRYDPEDGSKGVHGYPYRYYVWAHDANDLAAVAAHRKRAVDREAVMRRGRSRCLFVAELHASRRCGVRRGNRTHLRVASTRATRTCR